MSKPRDTAFRSLHDLGLAGWFGGTLMGAIGVNKAAAEATDPGERIRLTGKGWAAWTPAQTGFIAAHLAGSIGMLVVDRGRIAAQPGARAATVVKSLLTAAALGTTIASSVLGSRIGKVSPVPTVTPTEPSSATPSEVASAQQSLQPLQWVTPALTGSLIVLSAQQGEYQRTSSPLRGRIGQGVAAVTAKGAKSGTIGKAARKGVKGATKSVKTATQGAAKGAKGAAKARLKIA